MLPRQTEHSWHRNNEVCERITFQRGLVHRGRCSLSGADVVPFPVPGSCALRAQLDAAWGMNRHIKPALNLPYAFPCTLWRKQSYTILYDAFLYYCMWHYKINKGFSCGQWLHKLSEPRNQIVVSMGLLDKILWTPSTPLLLTLCPSEIGRASCRERV